MNNPQPAYRRGFTLVEMLITVTVIGIIVAMALGALLSAQEAAREQRTRSLIAKLHTQMMYRWESYQSRRIPMIPRLPNEPTQEYVKRRMWAQRELMRMELPQRSLDFVEDTNVYPATNAPSLPYRCFDGVDRPLLTETPALAESYLRRYNSNGSTPETDFESAECLYMIVTMGHDDSLGAQRFRASDVGDVDQDGMPEFIDGWGRPIYFLRWAPGFLPASALPANAAHAAITDLQTGDPENDHDPFDPLRLDSRAFRLMPLIYSAGSDSVNDIWSRSATFNLNDPYFVPATGDGLPAGTPMTAQNSAGLSVVGEGQHVDNITNHALEVR